MMDEDVHKYDGEDITVSYDLKRCIHVRECVRGLPDVFDPQKKPWIEPDEANPEELADVITRCPTGALHFERTDGGPAEETPDENVIAVAPDGPLYLRGDIEITSPDGDEVLRDTRVAACRCGASENKPLCDNSHRRIEFEADGTVPNQSDSEEATSDGSLRVTPTKDGPLHVEGPVEIDGQIDGSSVRKYDAWLCRCGGSQNKPFCDGTHARIGFSTERE
jgi:CDGSH-type Zn-finger protein/uncharacterized Fe-S cluster protein YjdI